MSTPYIDARNWIQRGPDTGGGVRMAKLVLSLYNPDKCPVSAGSCIDGGLDTKGRKIAVAILLDYAEHGETDELRAVGRQLWDQYPGIREVCEAMVEARQQIYRRWDREREEEGEREEALAEERARERRESGEPPQKPSPLRRLPKPA